jgi:hypothetical protein
MRESKHVVAFGEIGFLRTHMTVGHLATAPGSEFQAGTLL